jgi:hypothetical protein
VDLIRKLLAGLLFLLALIAAGLALRIMARGDVAPSRTPPAADVAEKPAKPDFAFALMGDVPYREEQEPLLEELIEDINSDAEVAFTIHDGDIKGGGQPCDNSVYAREARRFSTFARALVYTPGDNEWTDCRRSAAGSYDPVERLTFLRRTFFPNPSASLGQTPLRLEHQGPDYPENARWHFGGVTFATLHVVGSNNNRPSSVSAGSEQEFQARNAANLDWLSATFDEARARGSAGVLVAMQANILEGDFLSPSGFTDLVEAFSRQVAEFGKPVVLVHGDTHLFRIDQPRLGPGPPPDNFTRVETFGDPQVGWVRGTVDLESEELFHFEPRPQ